MNEGTVHIIGAGLAGLSAATLLAEKGRRVKLYEASAQAGGRCRSYHDSVLDAVIDNGNHLLLSGNKAAFRYLDRIGSEGVFKGTGRPVFEFIELKTQRRWTLDLGEGKFPFWLFNRNRRVPGTSLFDYLPILRLLWASSHDTVTRLLDPRTPLYRQLWHPILLSALNTSLGEASARLAGAILRGTLLKGNDACIPLVAAGLSLAFIDPALRYLSEKNASVTFSRRVQQIQFENGRAVKLEFSGGETAEVPPSDSVICAVPAWNAGILLPGVQVPDSYRAILNAHFAIQPPESFPVFMGVIGATTEWIFAYDNRLSVTVSDADRLMQEDREALAIRIWKEVSAITGLPGDLPPWQIVKEKRATFAATPGQEMRRPGTKTAWENVWLAGDYVRTGLPGTIEGAVLSGSSAADEILKVV